MGHHTDPALPAWCHLLLSLISPCSNPAAEATQCCARHRDASRYQQPQPCRCCCLCWPFLTTPLPLVLSCSPFPALPSPGIEAGSCQGEQRVGLGWEGKQSPCTTMELVVRAPLPPVNNHGHTGAFIQGKCHKMQQAVFANRTLRPVPGRWGGKRSTFLAPLQGSSACPTSPVPSAGLPSSLKLPQNPAGSVPAGDKPCQP